MGRIRICQSILISLGACQKVNKCPIGSAYVGYLTLLICLAAIFHFHGDPTVNRDY